jgi:hypothetical protein
MILGRSFVDLDGSYEVVVEGVPPDRLPGFLPGKPDRKKLEWLLGVCMPGHLTYKIKIQTDSRAGRMGELHRTYLGYSSYTGGEHAA